MARHEAFQALVRRFGVPTTLQAKQAVQEGRTESELPSRAARYAFRIAQRQKAACEQTLLVSRV